MPRRVNPILLLGLIVALVLSVAILASAKTKGGSAGDATGGGSASDALAAATGQVGTPYGFGTDGGGSFSCTGLVRHALRSAGVDANAPWDHMAYLSLYPTHDTPVPGDVVVYPDGVAMYVGDNTVVMANEMDQVVGYYPMDQVGTPLGFANPYGGTTDPPAVDPAVPADRTAVKPLLEDSAAIDSALLDEPLLDEPLLDEPLLDEPLLDEPLLEDPTVIDPALLDESLLDETVLDPTLIDPAVVDPTVIDPMVF